MVLLGGGKGGKIFWGLPYRFSTNPERIVKVRESAPSKIGLLCIGFLGMCSLLSFALCPNNSAVFHRKHRLLGMHCRTAFTPCRCFSLLKIQIFLLPTMLCIILFSSSISYHLDFVLNINMILATFLH